MTLDEAIKDMEMIAEENQRVVDTGIVFDDVTIDMLYCDDTEVIDEHLANYQKAAEEYRQIAEWLKELKRYKEASEQQPTDAVDRVTIKEYLDSFGKDTNDTATDCIRRSDILDAVGHGTTYTSEEVQDIIDSMPPVTPEPKTGEWIVKGESWYCSCCNESICEIYDGEPYQKYCPSCGSKNVVGGYKNV